MKLFPDIFHEKISNTIVDRILFLKTEMKDSGFMLEGPIFILEN